MLPNRTITKKKYVHYNKKIEANDHRHFFQQHSITVNGGKIHGLFFFCDFCPFILLDYTLPPHSTGHCITPISAVSSNER